MKIRISGRVSRGTLEKNHYLRLFNNSVFEWFAALNYLDPRLRGDDGQSRTAVIPAKLVPDFDRGAGI